MVEITAEKQNKEKRIKGLWVVSETYGTILNTPKYEL